MYYIISVDRYELKNDVKYTKDITRTAHYISRTIFVMVKLIGTETEMSIKISNVTREIASNRRKHTNFDNHFRKF